MRATHLSIALLCLGVIAIGAPQHLGSPWPGVVLSGLALVPWAWGEWLTHGRLAESTRLDSLNGQAAFLNEAVMALDSKLNAVTTTAVDQQQQLNSLRNAVSLRGTLGG